MFPRVKIDFANGALGQVTNSPDGCFGIITTGAPVAGKLELLKSYAIRKFDDARTVLGITAENNSGLTKLLKEFYQEAGDGTKLWLKVFSEATSMTEMLNLESATAAKGLLIDANGEIRALFVHRTPAAGYAPVMAGGLDGDVATARAAAQLLGEWSADTFMAPIFTIISGLYPSGNVVELTDLTLEENNRVGVMIGDTIAGNGCAIGLLAGRLAKIPVQRNIGRVKDGAIIVLSPAYLGSSKVEAVDLESVHDKGYISFRFHVGRSGYYFTDDPLATLETDDYRHITARRTIDKACRLAYSVMVSEMLEEIPVNDEGQVAITYAKGIETLIENSIIKSMTSKGELGNDPSNQNDTGVECLIDTNQNIITTGIFGAKLRVKPYGYSRFIDVELGFTTI
jgi:hypothetical protein